MINLRNLFDTEKDKAFVLMTDIALGNDIRIRVDKWGEIASKADLPAGSVKAGEELSLWRITNFNDFRKEVSITEDIKKGDALNISIYKI